MKLKHFVSTLALATLVLSTQAHAFGRKYEGTPEDQLPVQNAVFKAVLDQNYNQLERLVKSGANLNYQDWNNPNVPGMTPLIFAAFFSLNPAVTILANGGANLALGDKYGATALHFAAQFRNTENVSTLIQAGAPINARDEDGNTPANYAVGYASLDTLKLLINARADLELMGREVNMNSNSFDKVEMTPLMYAANNGRDAIVAELLKAKADPNHANPDGWTALHFAAAYPDSHVVKLLIQAGANVNARDSKGRTPLSLAKLEANRDLLIAAGAH